MDVVKRIRIEDDEVRELFRTQKSQWIDCRSLQRLERRQARLDQQRELIVETESGETKWIAVVGAGENADAGLRHRSDELLLLHKCRSTCVVVRGFMQRAQ